MRTAKSPALRNLLPGLLLSLACLSSALVPLSAIEYNGIEFPAGDISFADQTILWDPLANGGPAPSGVQDEFVEPIGPPDYTPGNLAATSLSLGDGGQLTVEFTDNLLTGSGDSLPDLHIFEGGGDVEDTFIEVSPDGTTWYAVGKVYGSIASVDLDSYGFGPHATFRFVRLTDDPNEGTSGGMWRGAEVDAIGAITTIPLTVKIIQHPQDITINSGTNTILSVVADGVGLTYQWYKGVTGDISEPIIGATSDTYDTGNLTALELYWVRVTNAAGSEDSDSAVVSMVQRFNVSVLSNNGTVTKTPDQPNYDDGDALTLSATADPGYAFVGWTGSMTSNANPLNITVNSHLFFVAEYVELPVITVQPQDDSILGGESVAVSVTATGSDLSYQWYEGTPGDTSSPIAGATGSTHTLNTLLSSGNYWVRVSNAGGFADSTAAFIDVTQRHQLTVTSANGIVDISPQGSAFFMPGTDVTITPTANNGYVFSGWTGDYTGTDNPLTLTMNADYNITANYVELPFIILQPQDIDILSGQSTTLSVISTGDSLNYQWYLGTSGDTSNPIAGATSNTYNTGVLTTPNMYWARVWNSYKSIDSSWAVVTITPSYTLDIAFDNGSISKSPDKTLYGIGEVVTITPTADPGYRFEGWRGSLISSDNPLVLTMTDDASLVADFVPLLAINTHPQGNTIMPAQTHVLSVDASGHELTYQWYEGTPGDTGNPIYGAVTSSFDPGDLDSTTTYWVRVTDTSGSLDSNGATITVQPVEQITQASDSANGEDYGSSVDLSGTFSVVGAPDRNSQGAIYMSEKTAGTWTETQVITASDIGNGDDFGQSVSIDGTFVIAGSPNDGTNRGSAYIYAYNSGTWGSEQKITASDAANNDDFGRSVAINGNFAVVGAPGENGDAGAAYVYENIAGTWTEVNKLTASDGAGGDDFGWSVAISGNTLTVGSPDNGTGGAAYVFEYTGATWDNEVAKLTDAAADAGADFGYSVAIDGDMIAVGMPETNTEYGSAFVYEKVTGVWTDHAQILANDGMPDDEFGWSISISSDVVVVGSRKDDDNGTDNSGSTYAFHYNGAEWKEEVKLRASNQEEDQYFGQATAIDGREIMVGAPNTSGGTAYYYELLGSDPLSVVIPGAFVFEDTVSTPTEYHDIIFPSGDISFVDQSISFDPLATPGATAPTAADDPDDVLNAPDYNGGNFYDSSLSLGNGGQAVFQFVDNLLSGSGDSSPDLHVFEIGADVEDTFVELSPDGITWYDVGKVYGSVASVDLDAYGFGPFATFSYVRLTDDVNEGESNPSAWVGADIDAVGAITTIPANPVIVDHPDDDQIYTGQNSVLSVTATGIALNYQWYRGVTGDTSDPIAGATSNTYDTGALSELELYWVRVSNFVGEADSNTAVVSIIPQYTVTTHSDNGTVTLAPNQALYDAGDTLTATAIPNAGYAFVEWKGSLPGTTNPLNITIDRHLFLIAEYIELPVITLQPQNATVLGGDPVAFTVNATGGNLLYQWYEGTSGDTSTPVAGATGSTFTIGSVTGTSNYWVRVSNIGGSTDSTTATVTVTPRYNLNVTSVEGVVSISPTTDFFLPGDNVTISVTPNNGYAFSGWTGDYTGTDNPLMLTMNSDVSITANYVELPQIITSPQPVTIASGENTILDVTATGYNLQYQWYRGTTGDTSNPIAGAISATYDTGVLTLPELYWVRAYNAYGNADSTWALVDVTPSYTLELTYANGVVTKSPNKVIFDPYEVVTLTPIPVPGAEFMGWRGSYVGNDDPLVLTMLSDQNIVADFRLLLAITQHPQGTTIIPAQSLELTVIATGTDLTYQWYEGVSGDTSTPRFGAITDVFDPGDVLTTTSYWVRVSDAFGYVDSDTATVIVQPVEDIETGSDTSPGDMFGSAVDMSGDFSIIGAEQADGTGKIYFFENNGGDWIEYSIATTSNLTGNDELGASAAIDGAYAAAGAPGHNLSTGSAYIYEFVGGVWQEDTRLAPAGLLAADRFGASIDIDGTTAVVGAPGDNGNRGAVYVFELIAGTWTEVAEIIPADVTNGNGFGTSVSISGDTILVGSPENGIGGAAYVFEHNGTTWDNQIAKLTDPLAAANDDFGQSVSIDGDTLVVGMPEISDGDGVATVFKKDAGTWTEHTRLYPLDGTDGDRYGYSVQVDGDIVIIGSPRDDDLGFNNSGSTYAYRFDGLNWNEEIKLRASDPGANEYYGQAVSVDGNNLLIGVQNANNDRGQTYYYALSGHSLNITEIDDVIVYNGTTLSPVSFTVSDDVIPVDSLIISASTSDISILSESDIAIFGNSYQRYLSITPPLTSVFPSVVTVTLELNNGIKSIYETFDVTIVESPIVAVERDMPDSYLPETAVSIDLDVLPDASVTDYTIVEVLPTGWTVSNLGGGIYDPATHTLTFGPFADTTPRTLTYELTPDAGTTGSHPISGSVTSNMGTESVYGDAILEEPNVLVIRDTPNEYLPDSPLSIELDVTPKSGVTDYTIVEQLPPGVVPTDTGGGAYDPVTNTITFGPFTNDSPQTITYEITPDTGTTGTLDITGEASSNLGTDTVIGDSSINEPDVLVVRDMPVAYEPNISLTVDLQVTPKAGITDYTIVEQLPPGVVPTNTGGGTYDPVTQTITFGPFTGNTAQTISYDITPDAGTSGALDFSGETTSNLGTDAVLGDAELVELDVNVERIMPSTYVQGVPLTVELLVTPGPGVTNYSIVEQLPAGVTMTHAGGGTYDPVGHTLTFGPYTNDTPHSIFYEVTPAGATSGTQTITGNVTSNLGTSPVTGNSTLDEPYIVAVRDLPDSYITDVPLDISVQVVPGSGVTSYSIVEQLPAGVVPTDTGGGTYDPITQTLTFGPFTDTSPRLLNYVVAVDDGTTGTLEITGNANSNLGTDAVAGEGYLLEPDVAIERVMPDVYIPNVPLDVDLIVTPGSGITDYTIVEQLPAGVVPTDTGGGVYDPVGHTLTFGPFTDGAPQVISYQLTPDTGTTGTLQLTGTATSNLGNDIIHGNDELNEPDIEAVRTMPGNYIQDIPFAVIIDVSPKLGITDYTIVEHLPIGIVPTNLGGGTYDPFDDTLTFGPFADDSARSINYELTPDSSVTGTQLILGTASSPYGSNDVIGDRLINETNVAVIRTVTDAYEPLVPLDIELDITPGNGVTNYMIIEQLPTDWTPGSLGGGFYDSASNVIVFGPFFTTTPQTITYELVPDAKASGSYPISGTIDSNFGTQVTGGDDSLNEAAVNVQRIMPSVYVTNIPLNINLDITPSTDVTEYTIVEQLPAGVTVSDTGGGVYNAITQTLTFGPFTDDTPQTLTYEITPLSATTGTLNFSGEVTSNIRTDDVKGASSLGDAGPLDHFTWSAIANPQYRDLPFNVTITARDNGGNILNDFTGIVNLSGPEPDIAIGTDTVTWDYPLHTFYEDSRTQIIYTAADIDAGATQITGISINVNRIPGQELGSWTIRIKHTALNDFEGGNRAWHTTGWNQVYQQNTTISSTGWVYFPFDIPFNYDGSSNLMVDFSQNNNSWTSSGEVYASHAPVRRTLVGRSDSNDGDPLNWAGGIPTPRRRTQFPNVIFETNNPTIAITPTVTANFVNGTWTGNITVLQQATNAYLVAKYASGAYSGNSNLFDVNILPELTIDIPQDDATEGDASIAATVSIDAPLGSDLTVNLNSDDTSEVTVPLNVTIPAGDTSVGFNLQVEDDTQLDGTQTATVTATATLFLPHTDSISIHDNESATVTVTGPGTATEGDSTLINAGTVTLSVAPVSDVMISLNSSDTTAFTVPASVTILAGQTTADFNITITDDTTIDGSQTGTLTANAGGAWTTGNTSISVDDNDEHLTITLPYDASESAGVLVGAGTLTIGGTSASDLFFALSSGDTSEVQVPAVVTIPAGLTTVNFDVTIVDDAIADGVQSASIFAAGSGSLFDTGNVIVRDDDINSFTFTPIATSQNAGVSFSTTITARDINNQIVTSFSGLVALSGTGDNGPASLNIATTGSFTNGAWTGDIAVNTTDTNVSLSAFGASGSGNSNTFDVNHGALNYFDWAVIASPQDANVPFGVSITAKDNNGYTVTNFNDNIELSGWSEAGDPAVEILSFIGYSDTLREYPNTLTAISNHFTNYNESSTTTEDPSTLAAELIGKDVFLIVEQESGGNMPALGSSWSSVLNDFVRDGGVVIALSHNKNEHLILDNAGLMSLSAGTFQNNVPSLHSTTHYLNNGVPGAFTADPTRTYTSTDGTAVLESSANGDAFVFERQLGGGHVVMIGNDYYNTGSDMDLVLANAVKKGQKFSVSITPSVSSNFINGQWIGSVTVLEGADDMHLLGTDATDHFGISNEFDVTDAYNYAAWASDNVLSGAAADPMADSDNDGIQNIFEYAFNLDPNALNLQRLTPGTGTSGMPALIKPLPGGQLSIEFIRRTDVTDITYELEISDDLVNWSASAASETVTPIDAIWERVRIVDTVNLSSGGNIRRFARVRITIN